MIDNLELIRPFLIFESDDDFYFLQILQRKKENDLMTANSRVIKNYYIKSVDRLIDQYDEIKMLCKKFNARASLRLNKRSFEQTAFQTLKKNTDTILSRDYKSVSRNYDKSCGQFNNDKNKKWIIDIDSKDILVSRVITAVKFCDPDMGLEKHYVVLPTNQGYHLITKPFNCEQFSKNRIQADIHKDNPVNLYIP